MSIQNWIQVGRAADIPMAGARVVRTPEGPVAIFRTGDDRFYALRDQCPHKGGQLSQGMVFGHRVACALHGLQVDLDSGQAVAPDTGCVTRFPVKVEDGAVFLCLSAEAARVA